MAALDFAGAGGRAVGGSYGGGVGWDFGGFGLCFLGYLQLHLANAGHWFLSEFNLLTNKVIQRIRFSSAHFDYHVEFNLVLKLFGCSCEVLEVMGLRLGSMGLFCLGFLFLPISRGSVLLRLIDIPFEHATRYHVWLGHLTMLIFTLHGLAFVIQWLIQGRCIEQVSLRYSWFSFQFPVSFGFIVNPTTHHLLWIRVFALQLLEWKDIGIANLPGVISLLAGLLMWITSLPKLRTINFELFFYTHQLYIVFVLFLALHVGDFVFSIAAGGIFIFMLDRFLRFIQSRRTVDVISAKALPCGTVELIISKPRSMDPNRLISSIDFWCFVVLRPNFRYVFLLSDWFRPAIQCAEFHLPASSRAVAAAMASVQCVIESIGRGGSAGDSDKSAWEMDREAAGKDLEW